MIGCWMLESRAEKKMTGRESWTGQIRLSSARYVLEDPVIIVVPLSRSLLALSVLIVSRVCSFRDC